MAVAAEPAWTHEITYTADVTGVLSGGTSKSGRALDDLDIILDGDLDRAIGLRGVSLHAYVLNNTGGAPNDIAGTLQGVDNIEVGRAHARLYELWLKLSSDDGKASALAGLYDLNSEFYATDASGLLLAPPFGIGSEFASTGPNGPSIFPSTAIGGRLKLEGENGRYLQAAVVNAHAATVGDPEGPAMRFDNGALLIAEGGVGKTWRAALGGWFYTDRQPDLRDLTPAGDPALSRARGGYVLAEFPVLDRGRDGPKIGGFVRIGASDGDTTPFHAGWQSGLLVTRVFASRPDSAFSIGVEQGLMSSKQRANTRDLGIVAARAESSVEITYSDKLAPRVTLQPDLQLIHNPGGDRLARNALVAALRVSFNLD